MKKFLLFALILAATLVMVSCNKTSPSVTTDTATVTTAPTTTAPAPSDDIVIAEGGKTEYVLITPAQKTTPERNGIIDISRQIQKSAGVSISEKTDSEPAVGKEIIIGNTSRAETAIAKERMGDDDYIVTVVDDKLVIYAKENVSYEYLFMHLMRECFTDTAFKVKSDLLYKSSVDLVEDMNVTLSENKRISMSLTLHSKKSNPGFIIGVADEEGYNGYKGFFVQVTQNSVKLYERTTEQKQLASKYLELETGIDYGFIIELDGKYLRCFVVDDAEGYEPWPEFEIFVGDYDGYSLVFTENSGYGAGIKDFKVEDYVAEEHSVRNYKNPVQANAADPDVIYYDGYYYLYTTGTGYPTYKSKNLVSWTPVGQSLPKAPWDRDTNYCWAPDVEYIDGKFYLVVCNTENGLGIAVSDSPTGPFECITDKPLLEANSIDGHLFVDDDGRKYLYYTSWYDGRAYGIYGVELSADLKEAKWETEEKLITPTESWEKTKYIENGEEKGGGVVEAPIMLKKDGVYFLVYSGSHFAADYAVGYATSSSPLGYFKKTKDSPILRGTSDVKGTGHCTIVNINNSDKMVIVYHSHVSLTAVGQRPTRIDQFRFAPNNNKGWKLEVYGPTTKKGYALWLE